MNHILGLLAAKCIPKGRLVSRGFLIYTAQYGLPTFRIIVNRDLHIQYFQLYLSNTFDTGTLV